MADKSKDRIFLGPPVGDTSHVYLRNHQDGNVSLGVLSTSTESLSDATSVAKIARAEDGLGYEVQEETRFNAPGMRSGPPQVSSRAYRANWDGVFGKKTPVGQA